MVPDTPTPTKVLFPKVTPLREFVVPEELEVQKSIVSFFIFLPEEKGVFDVNGPY